MASSSQANQPFVYEVFINFRGEDTRDNFVSHLFKALQHRGIQTYLDEENLEKGQPIKEDLEKAIKESRIVVVVLSENYGSSTWCLNELVKIMERKNKLSLFVIPIFYHVDPSVVRKQKRKFAEAFSEHEVEEVKSWKKALKQVSDLAGEHIRRKDNEASCVEKIVDMIFNKLSVKASAFRKSCVGIESRISKIRKLMDSKSEEVLFIGLWGMGGVGKTTLARAIFEDCKQSFEGSCFLGNVKGKKSEIHILQKKLLNTVLKKKLKGIDDVVTGASMISARLRFKRVLIVIDDVDNIQQLNDLANKFDWFGEGSRIIITTRDKHLIDEVHIEKFEVHGLPLNEALQLFSFHAFKDDHPHEDFKDLSLKVLSYADGLPLALSVLGDHLRQRPKDIWEDVLERLKDAPPDDIMGVLQISFDGLKEIEQNIFLDISCFFRGQFKDKVEERLESLGLHPKCGIDELHRKSLIYMRSVGPEIYVIEMHDLLQEMGWNINRNKCVRRLSNDDPRRYSRLWLQDDVIELLKFTEACEVERLLLSHVNPDDSMKPYLGWEVTFTNMSKLSLLEVSGDFFKGNYDANVTQPFGKFGNKLRWFSWYEYPGEFLPNGFHPQNLVQLHMKFSKIKGTPDFSHMPNLEVVDLCDSGLLVYVHPSLGNHIKIKRLDLCNCTSLEEFPSIHSMISLEFMDLSYTNIQNFPEICENLDSLRELKLEGTPINGLPKSISGIANGLQELMLICRRPYKEDFTSLDVVVKSFPGLVSIVIRGSGIISTLDFSHLPYLEKLDLSYSKKLVQVHASLGVHKGIKYINLSHCSKLKEFPPVVDMESLEKLNLSHTMLQKISEMSGNVKHLVELKLDNTLITTLPWSFGCATSLKILSMPYCDYLLQLPITILGLRREVIIIESGSVKYFMENYKDDDRVAFFDRNGLRAWTPGQPSRSCIYIRNCESLKQLPESLLSRTEVLEVEASPILVSWICFNLVDLLDKYQHLCNLRLHQCWIDDGDDDGGSAPNEYRLRRVPNPPSHFRWCRVFEPSFSVFGRYSARFDSNSKTNEPNQIFRYSARFGSNTDDDDDDDDGGSTPELLRAFSEWEPMCNMLMKRKKPFEVCLQGREIPSWFQHRFSNRHSMTINLPPLSEWYTDKLRGFVLGYLSRGTYIDSPYNNKPTFSEFDHKCCCLRGSHLFVKYIPIGDVNGIIRDWNGEDDCILFEQQRSENGFYDFFHKEAPPNLGFSFVYGEGEDNEAPPLQLTHTQCIYNYVVRVQIAGGNLDTSSSSSQSQSPFKYISDEDSDLSTEEDYDLSISEEDSDLNQPMEFEGFDLV